MATASALARKTVLGALWTITTGLGARALGLAGTLALTRFIAPDAYGEVSVASVVILTPHFFTSLGIGQYITAKQDVGREVIFNATVYFLAVGLVAILGVALVSPWIAPLVNAPGMVQYIPGLAVAALLERIVYIPDRLLIRDMRFRSVALRNMAGELSYTAASVGLAALGWGGTAIVAGNVLRAVVRVAITVPAVSLREWLTPSPLTRETARDIFSFGLPLSFGAMAHFGAQRWDNVVMTRLFGPGIGGLYTLAWNLADIPASQVGERVGDVLVPSFAKLEPEQRKEGLIRAITLLSLIIFPLAVGLGVVAPTILNDTFFNESWASAGPLLTVLSALGVTRPVGWVIMAYLQVYGRTRSIMALEWMKVVALVASIAVLGYIGGASWACAGVGLSFGLHALVSMWFVRRADQIPFNRLLRPLVRPLCACVPMAAAVLAVRYAMTPLRPLPTGVRLITEIAAGAVSFAVAALVIAPGASRDLLRLLRGAVRGKGKG